MIVRVAQEQLAWRSAKGKGPLAESNIRSAAPLLTCLYATLSRHDFAANHMELPIHMSDGFYQRVDTLCLRAWIRVVAVTRNDPAMSAKSATIMQRPEMLPVQREDDAILGHGNSENVMIFDSRTGLIRIKTSDWRDIMAKTTQTVLYSRRKLLVGQETGHP
jgi:hypothetical protein